MFSTIKLRIKSVFLYSEADKCCPFSHYIGILTTDLFVAKYNWEVVRSAAQTVRQNKGSVKIKNKWKSNHYLKYCKKIQMKSTSIN